MSMNGFSSGTLAKPGLASTMGLQSYNTDGKLYEISKLERKEKAERIERMYEKFEDDNEDLNIQKLSVKEIRIVTAILYGSIALSLAGVITMSVLLYEFLSVGILFNINNIKEDEYEIDFATNETNQYEVGVSLRVLEGIMRTFSSFLACFLFLSFPQRIFGDSWERYQLPHVEQGLLIILIFVIIMNPGFNPVNACFYWIDFADDVVFAGKNILLFSIASITTRDFYPEINIAVVRVSCVISVCSMFLYVGYISYGYGHTAKLSRKRYGYITNNNNKNQNNIDGTVDLNDLKSDGTASNGVGDSTFYNLDAESNGFNNTPKRKEIKTRFTTENDYYRKHSEDTHEALAALNSDEQGNNADIANEIDIERHPEKLYLQRNIQLRTKAARMGKKGISCFRNCFKGKCGGFFSQLIEITPVRFTCAVFFYMILSFCLTFGLDFTPSQVPFVSIITIMRICFSGPESLSTRKYSYVFLHPDEGVPTEGSWCTNGFVPFGRAIAGLVLVSVEFVLLAMSFRLIGASRHAIAKMPYAKTRGKQLGFIFFQTSTLVLFFFSVLNGTILVSVPPIGYWLIVGVNITLDEYAPNSNFSVDIIVDPLYQMGVNLNSLGFGCYQIVVLVWLLVMAFSYLPSTSRGWFGWFCAGRNPYEEDDLVEEEKRFIAGEANKIVNTPTDAFLASQVKKRRVRNCCLPEEAPVYLVSEKDVSTLADAMFPDGLDLPHADTLESKKKNDSVISANKKLTRLMSRKGFSMRNLHNPLKRNGPPNKNADRLIDQLKSNIFVLETEIILYHFMHMTYELGSYQGKSNFTVAEKQAMIDDPKYKLIAHLENSLTDTHCLVAASDDRIIVAFRGTVSVENMKTDWDSTLIVSEAASKINPPTSSDDSLISIKKVAKPPLVHRGFMDAYESIKDALHYCIETLLEENPNRVIFTTGHSLGGGLAVVCAMDLHVEFNPAAMGCTTWGCPKVGNYSFATRFNYAISCCRRFVCATDIITKIPFDPPFKDTTLNGWWHVGTEILLDVNGNMIIRPSTIESFLIHGWRRFSTHNHPRSAYACCLIIWCLRSDDSSFQPHWWRIVLENVNKYGVPKRLTRVPSANKNDLLDMLARSGIAYSRGRYKYRNCGLQTEDDPEDKSLLRRNESDYSENNIRKMSSDMRELEHNEIALGSDHDYHDENEEEEMNEGPTTQDILRLVMATLTNTDPSSRVSYDDIRELGEELIKLSEKGKGTVNNNDEVTECEDEELEIKSREISLI